MNEMPGMIRPELQALPQIRDRMTFLYFEHCKLNRQDSAPKTPEDDWNPLFVEALQKQDYVDYLLDTLLSPDMEERAALIASYGEEVRTIERRMADLAARDTAGRRTDYARSSPAPER